jgi:hypothetical protein
MKMNKLLLAGAAVLMASLSSVAFAKSGGQIDAVPYAVKARCDTLMQRFDEVSANPAPNANLAAAKSMASQGGALCRSAHYEEGGDAMEKALKLLGAPTN